MIGALGAAAVGYLTSRNPYPQPAHLAALTRVVIVLTLVLTGIYAQTNQLQERMGPPAGARASAAPQGGRS